VHHWAAKNSERTDKPLRLSRLEGVSGRATRARREALLPGLDVQHFRDRRDDRRSRKLGHFLLSLSQSAPRFFGDNLSYFLGERAANCVLNGVFQDIG
jgi:hypothetical protein